MDRRVLLVDDDALVRMLVTAVLEVEGWQVDAVSSLREAREALAGGPPPHVVVLDSQLPDGDGLSLLVAVDRTATRVVLHSGQDPGEAPSGVDAVVPKIGDPDALADCLASL